MTCLPLLSFLFSSHTWMMIVVPQETRGGAAGWACVVEEFGPLPEVPFAPYGPPLAARFGSSPLPKLLL